MQIKGKNLLLLILLISICYLIFMSFAVDHQELKSNLLVIPKSKNVPGVGIDKIEEINEENFLLTYEMNYDENVKSINSEHSVVLKGTNFTFPYITGYNLVEGSFFTQLAQEQKNRTVVLNELAAFELFGSFNIVGNTILFSDESYTIAGVINDEDKENKNVYIPITTLNNKPTTLLTSIDIENGITEEYVKNELKEVGITDVSHDFLNTNDIRSIIQEQAIVAILSVICIILILALKYSIKKFVNSYKTLKDLLVEYYFKDIIQNKLDGLYHLLIRAFCVVISILIIGILIFNIFKICISWDIDTSVLMKLNYDSFVDLIQFIQFAFVSSSVAFVTFIMTLIIRSTGSILFFNR